MQRCSICGELRSGVADAFQGVLEIADARGAASEKRIGRALEALEHSLDRYRRHAASHTGGPPLPDASAQWDEPPHRTAANKAGG